MTKRKHKVLLLGATGYQQTAEGVRVACCSWSSLSGLDNIRDYDMVILDLLDFDSDEDRGAVDWRCFDRLFSFRNAADVLMNGGAIVVVGDPRFAIPAQPSGDEDGEVAIDRPFLRWTGAEFSWDQEPGDTVQFVNDYKHRRFESYVSKLRKWGYSLANCNVDKDVLAERFNLDFMKEKNMKFSLDKDMFCVNRYNYALAFKIRLQIVKRERYQDPQVLETFGPVIFLPEIGLRPDDIRQLVLSDICDVQTSAPEPDWLGALSAPGQRQIDADIKIVETELETVKNKLQSVQARRMQARECLKLLYEREYALEPVVRDTLRGLGAHVEDPSEPNKEDGWLVVRVGEAIFEGVLEIKSTRNDQFGEDGRKQLLDWIDRGRTTRGKELKGIFVGNSAVDKPPKERPWAFSDSWTKAAELSGICAIKTEDLYVINLLNARGLIDTDSFWTDLFGTKGVFNMKRYWDLLTTSVMSTVECRIETL